MFVFGENGFSAEITDQIKGCAERYDILEKKQTQKAHVPHVPYPGDRNNRARGSYDHGAGYKEHECCDEAAYNAGAVNAARELEEVHGVEVRPCTRPTFGG